jgi:molecular chaperone DnaK
VDVNGILNVSAKDLGTGKENKITISGSGGLSKDEIEKMKREAEANAETDRRRRETIDLKNQADGLVYQTEKQLREHGDKVGADVRGQIEGALNNLKDALKSDDGERIKKGIENLTQAAYKLGEEIYKGTGTRGGGGGGGPGGAPGGEGQPAGAGAAAGGGKKDDDVIDAEYEVKE